MYFRIIFDDYYSQNVDDDIKPYRYQPEVWIVDERSPPNALMMMTDRI